MKLIDLYRVTLIGLLVCTLSAYGQQGSNNVEQRVDSILSQMSFADKLSYIGGTGFFDVKAIPGANLPLNPQLFQTDAGLGVRISPSSVRYPGGPVLAATWNPDRARDLGAVWDGIRGPADFSRSWVPEWTFTARHLEDEISNMRQVKIRFWAAN